MREPGGEDHSVVGQGGVRDAVFVDGCAKRGYNDRTGDWLVSSDRQRVTGVVIEPGQDFGVVAIGETVVGKVRLPGLVGLFSGKANVGRSWFLFGFRDHQSSAANNPVYRGA